MRQRIPHELCTHIDIFRDFWLQMYLWVMYSALFSYEQHHQPPFLTLCMCNNLPSVLIFIEVMTTDRKTLFIGALTTSIL